MQAVVEMDGAHFLKIIKDCKLISKGLTTTDVDLIFAKVRENWVLPGTVYRDLMPVWFLLC